MLSAVLARGLAGGSILPRLLVPLCIQGAAVPLALGNAQCAAQISHMAVPACSSLVTPQTLLPSQSFAATAAFSSSQAQTRTPLSLLTPLRHLSTTTSLLDTLAAAPAEAEVAPATAITHPKAPRKRTSTRLPDPKVAAQAERLQKAQANKAKKDAAKARRLAMQAKRMAIKAHKVHQQSAKKAAAKLKAATAKAKKEATQIKRAASPWNLYLKQHLGTAEFKDVPVSERFRVLGERFKQLGSSEAQQLQQQADVLKQKVAAKRAAVKATNSQKYKNPFNEFFKEQRPLVVSELPDLPFTGIARVVGERWRALTEVEKESYYTRCGKVMNKAVDKSTSQGKVEATV